MSSSSTPLFDPYARLDVLDEKLLHSSPSQPDRDRDRDRDRDHSDADSDTDSDSVIAKLSNLHKTYILGLEGIPALRGINLSIFRGEFLLILGTSGGGKSTLLNILGTVDKPTKGELILCQHRITPLTSDEIFAELRLRHIGFIFQSFNLIPSMTAEENIMLPMVLEGSKSREQMKRRTKELLARVGLSHRADHFPSQLSGGEQQRVTISRALVNSPSLLCADEPTGDLDSKSASLVLDLLVSLNRSDGLTIAMVTHDQALKQLAHRVVHMVDGKVLRIEIIDEATRRKAEEELRLKVEDIKRQQEERRGPAPGEEFITPVTEVRQPHTFYPYIVEQDERMKKRQLKEQAEREQAGRRP